MTSRIKYEKPSNYNTRVLVGPWVQNRLNSAPDPVQKYEIRSTYSDHYEPKPTSKVNSSVIWDLKLNSEESNFIPQTGRTEVPNYFSNFSTTYDLAFNHFPKCFQGFVSRKLRFRLGQFEPMDEYLPCYGNLTENGLRRYKNEEWSCAMDDPRRSLTTQYQDNFQAPGQEDYKFDRRAIPLWNSSKMNQTNKTTHALRPRDKPTHNVREMDLITVRTPEHFNPITWELVPETVQK